MKKILCIGDSLALPGHLNQYEDTWIYKLKIDNPSYDFITFFKRQLTTEVLVTMGGGKDGIDNMPKGADCLEFYKPDIVILQLGIVDCAPRLLYETERKIISVLPNFITKNYITIIKKARKRSTTNTYTSKRKFVKNLEIYFNRCSLQNLEKVIIIGISYPDEKMLTKNAEIITNVDIYNKIYLEFESKYSFIKFINPLDSRNSTNEIFEDGYHPNKYGHELIYSAIVNKI